jgi:hypothetical protein
MTDDALPPKLLSRPSIAPPLLDPILSDHQVQEIHSRWGDIAKKSNPRTKEAQQDDRELIASLIHAVDALARRSDEMAVRISALEQLLEEVVQVFSADLTTLRANQGV